MGSVYLFVPFYIAILGVESYGLIGFYSVILTLTSLADVGLSTTFAREAARQQDKHRLLDLLTTMERLLLLTTSIIASLIFVGADIIASQWLNTSEGLGPEKTAFCIRIMAITLVPQMTIALYTAGLFGLQRQGVAKLVQAFYTTVRSGLVILPIYFMPDLSLFFAWQFAAGVIFLFFTRAMLVRQMGFASLSLGKFSLENLRPVLKFAGGMMAISIIASINTQLDKVVVSKMFTVADLGYYTLASTLAQLPLAVASPMMVALFPRFTALNEQGSHDKASRLYESYSFVIASVSAMGAFGLIFFAGDVLSVWLMRDDIPDDVMTITRLLASGGLLLAIASTPFYFGLAHGHNKTSMLLGIATLVMTVPLLLLASRTFGLTGAALPWVLLQFITFAVLSTVINIRYYTGATLGWLFKCAVIPIGICAAAMLGARALSDILTDSSLIAVIFAAAIGAGTLLGGGYVMRSRLSLS